MTMITESKNPIQVADRLFLVLETLAEHSSCGLIELSTQLNLHKSTIHRLLTSLTYLGYVKQDDANGKYSLTFKIAELSNKMLSKVDIIEIVHPHLKKLMEQTGETVHFVQLDDTQAIYIDKVEAYQNSIRMVSMVGNHVPLYCSGVGKAIAASLPEVELKRIWEATDIRQRTPHTIVDYDAFLKELEGVHTNGYAMDNEENEMGVRCIAAALSSDRGHTPYAFSISAPANRLPDEKVDIYAKYILEAKHLLSKELF